MFLGISRQLSTPIGRKRVKERSGQEDRVAIAWKLDRSSKLSACLARWRVQRAGDIDRRTTFTKGECLSTLFSPLSAFAGLREQRKIYDRRIESRYVTRLSCFPGCCLESSENLLLFNGSNSVVERTLIFSPPLGDRDTPNRATGVSLPPGLFDLR